MVQVNDLDRLLLRWLGVQTDPLNGALLLLLHAVEGIPILLLTYLGAKGLRLMTKRAMADARWDVQLTLVIGRLVFLGAVVLGGVAYLNFLDGTIAGFVVGGVGLLGLAFGLAFQDVLKNFLSGIFLLVERPFRIGDEIRMAGLEGRVETIRLRVTVLRSAADEMILLPNQEVYTSAIVNVTGYQPRKSLSAPLPASTARPDVQAAGANAAAGLRPPRKPPAKRQAASRRAGRGARI